MSYRKININGQTWAYKVGRSNVHLRDPNGKGQVISYDQIGNTDPDGWHGKDWAVQPKHIKAWIERQVATTSDPIHYT